MSVEFRSAVTTGGSYNVSAISEDSGWVDGDVMILHVVRYSNFGSPYQPTPTGGWARVGDQSSSTGGGHHNDASMFFKVRNGPETNIDISAAEDHTATLMAFGNTSTFQEGIATFTAFPITVDPSSLDVDNDGSMVCAWTTSWNNHATAVAGGGAPFDLQANTFETAIWTAEADAGNTGTLAVTSGDTEPSQLGWFFVLVPDDVPPPPSGGADALFFGSEF